MRPPPVWADSGSDRCDPVEGVFRAIAQDRVFAAGPTAPWQTSCAKSAPLPGRGRLPFGVPGSSGLMVRTPDKRLALARFAAEAQNEVERPLHRPSSAST